MVDAGAAVAAAQALNGTTVSISPSPASGLQAGQTLTLTSALTGLPAGRSVASIAWTVVNSGSIVTGFASGSTTASATIVPSAAGSFIVQVQYTDDQGVNYPQLATISVAAVPVVTPTPTPTPSGGGGSGGTSPLWLALLALAAWAVKPRPTVVV
jgi:serine protease